MRWLSLLVCKYYRPLRLLGLGGVFQNIGWLAVEFATDGLQSRETNGFGLTSFEDREVDNRDIDPLG